MAGRLTGAKPSLRSRSNRKKSIQDGFDQAQQNTGTQTKWQKFKQNCLVQGVTNGVSRFGRFVGGKFQHAGQDIVAGYHAFRDNRRDRHAMNDWGTNIDYFQNNGVEFQMQQDGSFRMVGTSDKGRSLIERIRAYQAENAWPVVQASGDSPNPTKDSPAPQSSDKPDKAQPSAKDAPSDAMPAPDNGQQGPQQQKKVQPQSNQQAGQPAPTDGASDKKPDTGKGKSAQGKDSAAPDASAAASGKADKKAGSKDRKKAKQQQGASAGDSQPVDDTKPDSSSPDDKKGADKPDASASGDAKKDTAVGFFQQAMANLASNGKDGMDAFVFTLMEGCKQYLAMSEEDKNKNVDGLSNMIQSAGKILADKRAAQAASMLPTDVDTDAAKAARARWQPDAPDDDRDYI